MASSRTAKQSLSNQWLPWVVFREDFCTPAMVGTTAHGLSLYSFCYRGQDGTFEGVMAQDVLEVRPDAVIVGPDGYYRVDYAKLGIEFQRLN